MDIFEAFRKLNELSLDIIVLPCKGNDELRVAMHTREGQAPTLVVGSLSGNRVSYRLETTGEDYNDMVVEDGPALGVTNVIIHDKDGVIQYELHRMRETMPNLDYVKMVCTASGNLNDVVHPSVE
ncbi:hypothetical protein ACFL1B_05090 [Nanoarchaeota archaeon]